MSSRGSSVLPRILNKYFKSILRPNDFNAKKYVEFIAKHFKAELELLNKVYFDDIKLYQKSIYPDALPFINKLHKKFTIGVFSEGFKKYQHRFFGKTVMYEMPKEARAELGKKCREHALRDYNVDDMVKKWDETLSDLIARWSPSAHERWKHVEL